MGVELVDAMIPIFICGILPVAIVLIVNDRLKNRDNKRAEVLMKAIESDKLIDTDKLAEALGETKFSVKEKSDILSKRLLRGLMFSFIGIALIIGAVALSSNGSFGDTSEFGLMCGAVLLAIGLSYLIVYWVTSRQKHNETCQTATKDNNEAE